MTTRAQQHRATLIKIGLRNLTGPSITEMPKVEQTRQALRIEGGYEYAPHYFGFADGSVLRLYVKRDHRQGHLHWDATAYTL